MSSPVAPKVEVKQHHRSLCVADLTAAIEFYTNERLRTMLSRIGAM